MTREQLQDVRAWADGKLAAGAEPPWAWYQLMKLREALDAVVAGMDTTKPLGSPESAPHSETHLRLVANTHSPDSVPRHPAGLPVRMPM
jgi:hypothetical protein